MPSKSELSPELSIVVPTFGRAQKLWNLLARCEQQTLAPRRFELVVVDDGSPEPLTIDPADFRFALTLLRQPHAGPAAARNLGLERCRGGLVMFLNDDALPAFDLFEKHLDVHGTRTDKVAVLGTFDFTAEALRHPFVQVLNDSDLLFDYVRMRDGALHPWQYFWTSNISLPLAAVREAGGFDAKMFAEAIGEDIELGFRLSKNGFSVLFRKDLVCEHDHVWTADAYFQRALRFGIHSARLSIKHGRDLLFGGSSSGARPEHVESRAKLISHALTVTETYHAASAAFLEKMRCIEEGSSLEPIAPMVLSQLRSMARSLSQVPFCRGQLMELAGFDPEIVMHHGPARGRLTSIVVTSCDAIEQTVACLTRLRETEDPSHPTEILFVDNGSSDGSAEFLAAQPDVRLIRNGANLGVAKARNQALAHTHGEYVVFLDNDAMVTPGWLGRLLYHVEVDPLAGCISPTADRAAHGQQVAMNCAPDPASIAEFARGISHDLDRQHWRCPVLASFCLLVPRRVLNAIGGFDERFTPAGYDGDDFTLRATLAGFKNRCARDVFVRHEAYSGRRELGRRAEILRTNWERFAAKWGLSANSADELDSHLAPILARRWMLEELRIPVVCGASQPALLPQPVREDHSTRRP